MAKKLIKPNFGNKLALLIASATEFLYKNIKVKQTIVFATEKEINDRGAFGLIDELPAMSHVGKHGDYNEYAILSIERKSKTNLVLHVFGKGEAFGDKEEFDLGYLQDNELLHLADELATKI